MFSTKVLKVTHCAKRACHAKGSTALPFLEEESSLSSDANGRFPLKVAALGAPSPALEAEASTEASSCDEKDASNTIRSRCANMKSKGIIPASALR